MPAAEAYLRSGYRVFGCDCEGERMAELEDKGGTPAESPARAAGEADTVIVLVLNDEQVLDVIGGPEGILEQAAPGSTVICMSTINRSNLESAAEQCAAREVKFVDSPFTGGPARIAAGTAALICAAPPQMLEAARPVLEVVGNITVAGDSPGMGQAVKHCNQLLVTAIHAATIELITLARRSGVEPELVCDVVGNGIGGNDYFRLLSKAILTDTASPGGMGQLWKDVNIVVNSARSHNLPLLVATAASHYFNMAVAQGMAGEDSARLIEVLRRMSGPPQGDD
jgi:3-hydroxyisobutyrate dehydrogenase-like beta-hydroxyacid dehydrogenase